MKPMKTLTLNGTIFEIVDDYARTNTTEAGGGASGQANLEQNDPTQPDYVKGRTHYIETMETDTLEFDGNIEGREVLDGSGDGSLYLVKMSDTIVTKENLIGGTLTAVSDGTESTAEITEDLITDFSEETGDDYAPIMFVSEYVVVAMKNAVFGEINLSAGVWFAYASKSVYAKSLKCNTTFAIKTVHKLSDEFLKFIEQGTSNRFTWDGKTKNLPMHERWGSTYKVSDALPVEALKKGGYFIFSNGVEEVKVEFPAIDSENVSGKVNIEDNEENNCVIISNLDNWYIICQYGADSTYPDTETGLYLYCIESIGYVKEIVLNEPVPEWKTPMIKEEYIPPSIAKHQKLTFTGAVTAEYDGSGAVTVTITDGSIERIEKLSTDTEVELQPNKLYIFPEMESLSVTFTEASKTDIVNEYHFVFQSGTTATTLTLPDTVNIPSSFTVDANKIYEISIMENCMAYQSWEVTV